MRVVLSEDSKCWLQAEGGTIRAQHSHMAKVDIHPIELGWSGLYLWRLQVSMPEVKPTYQKEYNIHDIAEEHDTE